MRAGTKAAAARKPFNTWDGAKIGMSFHDQVKEVMERNPGFDATIFAMCFWGLVNGMRSDKARFWMQCALHSECEAIRADAMPEVA